MPTAAPLANKMVKKDTEKRLNFPDLTSIENQELQTTLSTALANKEKLEKELANCKVAFESLTQKIIRLSTIANSTELVTLDGIVWISQLKGPLD